MQMTFINPTRSIRIGDDTGIGGDCLLFGHSSWLSKFEGYPVEFDSIEIGRSVSLAWRVFVLPGTKIGDGAAIGANSLVRGEIPPRCLAVGFPARVVSRPSDFPRTVGDAEKVEILKQIIDELIEHFRDAGFECHRDVGMLVVQATGCGWFRKQKRVWRCAVLQGQLPKKGLESADVNLSLLHIPEENRRSFAQGGQMWIDIEKKERSDQGNNLGEEVVQYLKRYGLRLFRA
jgi:hypothetical protein